ncbi:hypothetical protein BDV95DRAFT_487375 [Massariosphaeria phaeospora]|uniref:Uncharacterized protein n=1 Tax=Massariosphaeria phaeospora TaxID=100035 RepID=A0A7C8MBW4_9PLEO|nr:hypothetical protein BDV95DRAFT_487375 [Massariosphaeria phaeospora]
MIGHAVRRGLEHPSMASFIKRASEDGPQLEVPKWGVFILASSFFLIAAFLLSVDYSLKDVVATLAMVETPTAAITVSAAHDEAAPKEQKEALLETGPEITLVLQKPITSKIRKTLRHLVSETGTGWARMRGAWYMVLYNVEFHFVSTLLELVVPHVPGRIVLIAGATGALLANLHAAWTHKVISMPSSMSLYKRIPERSYWKTLAFPAGLQAAMPYLSLYIVRGFAILFGLTTLDQDVVNYSSAESASVLARFFAVVVIAITCTVFLCLPAYVTLIRIEASILSEDQDTIVPFDRSFAGKVVARILGGSGSIGFIDAWKSFNWEARRRVIKLYVKIFFVNTALILTFAHVFAFEMWAIMGPAIQKYVREVREAQN